MSITRVSARFLGEYLLCLGDESLQIKSRKARALFAYLAIKPQAVRREKLAELLWTDGSLSNLRQVIYELRKLPQSEEFLINNSGFLKINISSDLKEFEEAIKLKSYEKALDLYKGKLLAGFNCSKMEDFSDWLEIERARLEQLYLRALEEHAQELEENREYEKALELCDKIIEIDVLNESIYRTAMKLSAYLGKRQNALKYYQKCVMALKENLSIDALAATRELADEISRGNLPKPPKAIKSLDKTLFQVLAAIYISKDNSLSLLSYILDKNALEITADLDNLYQQGYLNIERLLKPELETEVSEMLEKTSKEHLHFLIAEYSVKHKFKDEYRIAKHYLAANKVNLAAEILLKLAQRAFDNSEENLKEIIFKAVWTNSDDERRYEALSLLRRYSERHSENELQKDVVEELKELSWKIQDDEKIASVLLISASLLLRSGDMDKALKLSSEAKEIGRRISSQDIVSKADNSLAAIYFYSGKFDKAEGVLADVLKFGSNNERVKALNNLAAIAGVQGDFENSYEYFAKALTLARQMKNLDYISACLLNLANTAEKLSDYVAAEKRFREALSLTDRTKDPKTEVMSLINLAIVHGRRGALGLSWNTATEAFEFAEEYNNLRGMALAKSQQMDVARLLNDFDLAIGLAKEYVELSKKLNDERLILTANWNLMFLKQKLRGSFDKNIEDYSEELFKQNILDVAVWANLQLALNSKDVKQSLRFTKRVTKLPANKHQRYLIKIIKQRNSLLINKEKSFVVDGLEPNQSQPYAEHPLAYYLLSRVYENLDSYKSINYKNKAGELLKIQAEGLPKKMKESHINQIENWEVELKQ